MKLDKIEIRKLGDSLINKFMIEGFDYTYSTHEAIWREFATDLADAAKKIRLCELGIHFW